VFRWLVRVAAGRSRSSRGPAAAQVVTAHNEVRCRAREVDHEGWTLASSPFRSSHRSGTRSTTPSDSTDLYCRDLHRFVLVQKRAIWVPRKRPLRPSPVVLPSRLARNPETLTDLIPGGAFAACCRYALTAKRFQLHISPRKLSQRLERIRRQGVDISHLHTCQDNLTQSLPGPTTGMQGS